MTQSSPKPRILIVDDHPANRLAFRTLLEPLYEVSVAANGIEALDLASRQNHTVILLDVRMPGMDGFEVAESLRKQEHTRYTPIVFMSAYDHTVIQAKKGYIAGATDYIFSPVDEELLKFKVATYVQMTLRNDALRLQVYQLKEEIRALREEIGQSCLTDPVQHRIRNLERHLAAIKLELEPQPA